MNWLIRCFTENVGLKILSLAVAVTLWAVTGSDPVTETVFQVPVEFTGLPAATEMVPEQTSLQLRVRGPSHVIRQATSADFSVKVNLSATEPTGERTYSLHPAQVEAPDFLEIIQIVPPQVRFTLEPTMEKEVPVQPRFSEETKAGYRVKKFHVEPPRVKIAGPRSRVQSVEAALTDPVDLTDFPEGKIILAPVYVPDAWVRLVETTSVSVSVELEKVNSPAGKEPSRPAR